MAQQYSQGGWYGGRQYWNGQLGAPGVVMDPSSPGYMQPVSSEVNAQSDAAQGLKTGSIDAYLAGLRAAPGGDAGIASDGNPLPAGGGTGASALSTAANGSINLQSIYDSAYKAAGVTDLQSQYDELQKQVDDRKSKLAVAKNSTNENPWGAEATRTGKISKLESFANDELKVLIDQQNALGTRINQAKADVETKLNLATKQFDINQSAQSQSLSMFNSLLSAGALSNATADDLAQFARTSGLPTSFLSSAIKASKAKDTETKLIESTDDAGNVTVSLVTIKDGQLTVAGKQSLGNVGKADKTTASEDKTAIAAQLASDAAGGVPLEQIFQIYGPFLDPNVIYNLYNQNSSFGPAKQTLSELAKYGVKDINKDPFNINPAPVK